MNSKQRRAHRRSTKDAAAPTPWISKSFTADGFANFQARLGYGTGNQADYSHYNFTNRVTMRHVELEAAYRQSWIVGIAVDAIAEDMTRGGISIETVMDPADIELLDAAMLDLQIWPSLAENIRWGHLFGGSIAVMLIDGQDFSTELNFETIGEGQFKGLAVFDRWRVTPSTNDLIDDFGPDLGKPKYYTINADQGPLRYKKIHHSRVIRHDGIELPYFQRRSELMWGESVLERIWDRLTAFDSTTLGAAQLAYKAHLRTYYVENLREIIASGGTRMEALKNQIDFIRSTQTNEGMTLMDASDKFEAHQYTFAGLSDLILQIGQQVSGSLQVPLVRLFGQSPAGLNSTGESDLRVYNEGVKRRQENKLRRGVTKIMDALNRSVLGERAPNGFRFSFNPLWEPSDQDKANMGQTVTQSVVSAHQEGIISDAIALKELRSSNRETGMWSNITDEDIKAAEDAPPRSELIGEDNDEEKPVAGQPEG